MTLTLQDLEHDSLNDQLEFDDGDIDDEIDPALKAQIDRLVCRLFLIALFKYFMYFSNFSGWKLFC